MSAALHQLSLSEAAAGLAAGAHSARALTESCLAQIEAHNAALNAFVTVDAEQALAAADASDARRAAGGALGLLDGIPVGLKDIFCHAGRPTSAASRILEGYVPPYSSTLVEQLEAAGAVILGKLNMDEFAMGSANAFSRYGRCNNHWDTARTPGGSSGGSAAAVAARMCYAAMGTDTGGSIRQPAALTGLVGLKPTYGRVSRFGVIAFASSLDQPGPFTRTVEDMAEVLQVIAAHDPRDSTSVDSPAPDYRAALGGGVAGLKVGLPREYFGEGLDPEVAASVRAAADWMAAQGAEIKEISLPHTEHGIACYYTVAPAEASSNLARYDGVRYGRRAEAPGDLAGLYQRSRSEGFGPEVQRRVLLGTYVLSAGYYDAYYLKAQQVRALVRRDFDQAFEAVDLILTPTSPQVAWAHGALDGDPLAAYMADVFTVPTSLAGLPGMSLPCGFSEAGLPIGMQLIGRPFDEATLLRAGKAYQDDHAWHRQAPEVTA